MPELWCRNYPRERVERADELNSAMPFVSAQDIARQLGERAGGAAPESRSLTHDVERRVEVVGREDTRLTEAENRHDRILDRLRQRHEVGLVDAAFQRHNVARRRRVVDLRADVWARRIPVIRAAASLRRAGQIPRSACSGDRLKSDSDG